MQKTVVDLPFTFKAQTYEKARDKNKSSNWVKLKKIYEREQLYNNQSTNHRSISAPPSQLPPKRYCDITGFEAPYTDPKTRLFFADSHAFEFIRTEVEKPPQKIQHYLAIRSVNADPTHEDDN